MSTTTLERTIAVIARTFRVDAAEISQDTVAADVDGWDSVSHTTLILALEGEFGRELPFDDIQEASDVGGMVQIIEAATRA